MFTKLLWLAVFITGTSVAASVHLPGGSLTVPAGSASGASFTYTGTLTESDTIALAQTGNACLQPNGGYCTNGAGVITVAATLSPKPVGEAIAFAGPAGIIPAGTWTYGSVLMSISGVGTVQLWPTVAGNGLGSAKPPASLNLRGTTLSGLGFPNFSVTNPTITFIVDEGNFGDNSGRDHGRDGPVVGPDRIGLGHATGQHRRFRLRHGVRLRPGREAVLVERTAAQGQDRSVDVFR